MYSCLYRILPILITALLTTVPAAASGDLSRKMNVFSGTGFGLDFAVSTEPVRAGAAGTWFWIDPEYSIVLVGMIQRMGAGAPGSPLDIRHLTVTALYQALVEPGK